ncbi:glucans biosynthesis glucosyltransferase MdoH [Dankookia sp. GCM10030260]|uniref:glucans biosynthesis glucosyltransferase MdoH n=1 Tax=Dankookia sp. GCM10030260 TaxID=3273390 RepID=UPI00361EEA33
MQPLQVPRERLGLRRSAMAGLTLAVAGGLVGLGWWVLRGDGWTAWEALILLCLTANSPWIGLTAATGIIGLCLRLAAPGRADVADPAGPSTCITARTVLAVCIRLEDMDAVLPPLWPLLRDLRAMADGGDRFVLAVLSDTPDGTAADAEKTAVAHLAAAFPEGAVLYRRRSGNAGYKAGNLMDFLDDGAAEAEFLLALDADSVMSASTVRRLVLQMQADPGLAILQPTIAGHGADTSFGRVFGFGQRHGTRIWATGQAWWQGPQGPYWGHNALIRIAPFCAHARLPALPGGGVILSHDHVEAALLHAAGWAVRVLPEDAGSAERHPPDLQALFSRDLRWAAGNMQYRHLLRRADLGRIGRFQMVQAMLHYALTPLWFALLPLAAVNAATGGGEGTSRTALLLLLGGCFLALNLPKLAGYAETLWRPAGNHRWRLLGMMGREVVLGLMVDAIAAFDRTCMLARLAGGLGQGWEPQARAARGLSWGEAGRRFGAQTLAGVLLAALFASAGPFALVAALPILAGLLLAVPVVVLTARPDHSHAAVLRTAKLVDRPIRSGLAD